MNNVDDKEQSEERRFRKNTIKEKKEMRNSRRRRMRRRNPKQLEKVCIKQMKQKIEIANLEMIKKDKRIETLRCMTRTFWERWKWELEKRKEALWLSKTSNHRLQSTEVKFYINEIDPSLLTHPIVKDKQTECYLGRGSFGIVN